MLPLPKCKLLCKSKRAISSDSFEIIFTIAVNGGSENELFFRFTPSGLLTFSTVNSSTAEQFSPGLHYYIEFSPAGV